MLRIRLTRIGKKHEPHYRVVVADKRAPIKGKFIEIVGHYHPAQASKDFVVDADKVKSWMGKGAMPSDTVWNLLCKEGILPKEQRKLIRRGPEVQATVPTEVTPDVLSEPKAEVSVVEEPAAEAETAETPVSEISTVTDQPAE